MLEIKNIHKNFGGLKAVANASMKVAKGSITGLIGPNGAGKTTLFNTIAGLYKPNHGKVLLEDEDISELNWNFSKNENTSRYFEIFCLFDNVQ